MIRAGGGHPDGLRRRGDGAHRSRLTGRSWAPLLLGLLAGVLVTGCVAFKRAVNITNSYQVLAQGHPEIETRARQHLDRLLFSRHFQRRGLEFSGDVIIKTVPAVRRDRLGVPFWSPANRTRDRSGGLTVFTGRSRPVIIILAVMPDGTWDDRTLKHECAHVVLLWNGIEGHPPEFARYAPLWD